MATKILVVGAVQGELGKAVQKMTKLHSKTDFAFALVLGDLFNESEANEELQALLSGRLTIPLPTYFTIGDHALPQPIQEKLEADTTGEVCPNLFYLGRRGTHTIDGIKVVFLGGRQVQSEESLTQSISKYHPLFLENEARALQGNHSAHILITNQWPSNIQNGSSNSLPEEMDFTTSSSSISNLCATLKPRYHFSSSPLMSWKREPFIWPMDYASDSLDPLVTRFESLGSIHLKSSQWISAFTLDPTKPPTTQDAQRLAPFTVSTPTTKRKRDVLDPDPYPGRFNPNNGYNDSHRPRRGNKRSKHQNPDDCFMCLGKPTFDASMVISISDECFLTSLRGPLPTVQTFPQLNSTGNLMIIPMYHAADDTSSSARKPEAVQLEYDNMQRYRHALQHMLLSKGAGKLGYVCWEVNRTGIRHFHWQLIACPQELINKGLVDGAFKIAAEKNEYQRFQACPAHTLIPGRNSDYFRVWIWSASASSTNGASGNHPSPIEQADAIASGADDESTYRSPPPNTTETSMYFDLPPEQRGFNIQFGRTVMSGLLNLEHRADWRSVPMEEGDEARDAEAWKEDFRDWDFAMN
ncbi:hypothetical protein H2198_007921 [Neophaeococcomyces mojaviensis]|uniref:Uncharacterized protein n=1 Tax=Neophaeococcomyces mojaviensis TaxID=3383035 RepID=A0ACC2ZYQ4_9EURO|nr:hypothetical protein H2198_007921 [Knufia sp. JES_112]